MIINSYLVDMSTRIVGIALFKVIYVKDLRYSASQLF